MMTKDDYLRELQANIRNVPYEEVGNIIQYYSEYFDEAGEENTQKVIEELGPPAALATRVCADYCLRGMENGVRPKSIKRNASNTWLILLAVFGSPLWLPVAMAAVIVLIALAFAGLMIVLSLAIVAVVLLISGVMAIGTGIASAFQSLPTAAVMAGSGMVMIGTGILLVLGVIGIVRLIELIFIAISRACIRKGNNR